MFDNPYDILIRPRMTEKATEAGSSTVVFEVPIQVTKFQVKKAVERVFNVEVKGVRTSIVRGKIKRRGRTVGKQKNWKKAIIVLKDGFSIDLFGTGSAV